MIAILGLSIALTMPRFPASTLPPLALIQGDVLDTIIPSIDVKEANVHVVLKKLFDDAHLKMWVSPEIELVGKITLKLENSRFELVLQNILSQVSFTYMYKNRTFLIIPKTWNGGDPGPPENLPIFHPEVPTSKYVLRNPKLFLTPKRTIRGTFDLLTEAARSAKFEWWDEWSYGSCGFAISLSFEAIDKEGVPLQGDSRLNFDLSYLSKFGMARLPELFSSGYGNEDRDYRMIVITTCDSSVKSKVLWRYPGFRGLPNFLTDKPWNRSPKVTAYVYEFRRQKGSRLASLLKPGQSKISARRHLVLSGLWSEKELGN